MAEKRGRAGAKSSGKAKSSVYDDVFGGPPKYSAPFPARREDYAEIFGGVASKCSIPYLDLPPPMGRSDGASSGDRSGGGKGGASGIDYNEVFGRLDFDEFPVPYEELVSDKKQGEKISAKKSMSGAPVAVSYEELLPNQGSEEIISLKESLSGDLVAASHEELVSDAKQEKQYLPKESMTLRKSSFSHQAEESSKFRPEQLDKVPPFCSKDDLFSSDSHQDSYFNAHYSNSNAGAGDSALGGKKHIAEHDYVSIFSTTGASNLMQAKTSGYLHTIVGDVNRKSEERLSPTSSSDASRSSITDIGEDKRQATNPNTSSKNDNATMYHHSRSSSSHSVSSGDVSHSDMYLSASDISLRTQPLGVPPPSRPPPKMFHKQPTFKMRSNPKVANSNHEKNFTAEISGQANKETEKDSHHYFDVEVDASSAAAASAAAMKEAMEQAEATLKSAKELMERNRDNFHVRKKVSHQGRKIDHSSMGAERFVEGLSDVSVLKEANQFSSNALKESTLDQTKLNEANQLHDIALKEENKVKDDVKSRSNGQQAGKSAAVNEEDRVMVNRIVLKEQKTIEGAAKPYYQQMEAKATLGKEGGNVSIFSDERNTGKYAAGGKNSFVAEEDEKKMLPGDLNSCQLAGGSEENPGQWKLDKEYYELISNEKNCKRIPEFSQLEGFSIKNATTAKISDESENGHKETTASEVERDTPLMDSCEKIKMEESFTRSRDGYINSEAEEIKVISDVSEFNVPENIIGQQKSNDHHGRDGQKVEQAQLIHHEEVETPYVHEDSSGKAETEPESLNVFEGNHESGKGKTDLSNAEAEESEGNFCKFDGIRGDESKQVKVVATERAFESKESKYSVADVTCEPCDSEENLNSIWTTAILDDLEIKVADRSCSFGEMDGREAAIYCGDSEMLEKEEMKHDIVEKRNQMEEAGQMHCHEEGQKLGMKQESCFPGNNHFTPDMDHKDVIEEVVRKIKAVEETVKQALEEQEKPTKAKDTTAFLESTEDEKDNLTEVPGAAGKGDCSENKAPEGSWQSNKNHEEARAQYVLRSSEEKKVSEENHKTEEDNDIKGSHLQSDHSDTTQEAHPEHPSLEDMHQVNSLEVKVKLSISAQDEWQENKNQQEAAQASSLLRSSEEKKVYEEDYGTKDDDEIKGAESQYCFSNIDKNSNTTQEGGHEVSRELDGRKVNLLEKKSIPLNSAQDTREGDAASFQKLNYDMKKMEQKETEKKMDREQRQAEEQARKLEEEREREREREKDRIAVERATREAHERALAEAKERAERIAVERVTAEARQRALKEARGKAERATAEALEKSLAEKAARDARLRAERAAVERATAEARERAAERARAEKAAADARDRAYIRDRTRKENVAEERTKAGTKDGTHGSLFQPPGSSSVGESELRHKARLERHQRTAERAAKALAEKNKRDILAQREQAERDRLSECLDADIKRWSTGKEGNLRALLSTLQYILGPDSGWQPIPLTEVITAAAVKKAYRKATLCVHPDKVQQRGASIQQKYICEKVFDLLKEAWNRFNSEER